MGASCCAQQLEEQNSELENKYKYDPSKQPTKGALSNKKMNEEKKIVKFPTRIKQEDEDKNAVEDQYYDDVSNPLVEKSYDGDAKSHKSVKSGKSYKSIKSNTHNTQTNKKILFSKQVSQFVKAEDE